MSASEPASLAAGDSSALGRAAEARPAKGAWWVLWMLTFVYVLNFLDRQLLSILAKPIQDELLITDGQIGLISGLYFAVFYCVIAIPVGWLADRSNRVRILACACFLWSAATVACGLARNYPQLVIARMTVGIGEAGGVPPSYAIISDYFPTGTRGRALGLYNMGPPIGMAMGVAFGATIADAFSWRDAFVVVGVVGMITAVIVYLFVKEPARGRLDKLTGVVPAAASEATKPAPVQFWPTFRMFFTRPTLLLISLASGATQFVTYALLNFTVLFLMREKGMTLAEIAVYYALLVGIAVSAGMYVSGRLLDWLSARSDTAYAYLPAVALVLAVPFFIGFVWAPTWQLSMAFLAVPMFLNYFYLSPAVTLVQEKVKPDQRVLSGALLLLVMNLIGLGLGPTYLGAMSDFLRANFPDNSLQIAFYTLVPFYFLAVALFVMLARVLRSEAAKTGGRG